MQVDQFLERNVATLGFQIEYLPANHAGRAGGTIQLDTDAPTERIAETQSLGACMENFHRKRHHPKPGFGCGRHVELPVGRRPATPQVVVVHARQVVVDERVGMHDFHGGGEFTRVPLSA